MSVGPLAVAARRATQAVRSLVAVLPPDPLVEVIEGEMQLAFAHELDPRQLRAAAQNVAYRLRAGRGRDLL